MTSRSYSFILVSSVYDDLEIGRSHPLKDFEDIQVYEHYTIGRPRLRPRRSKLCIVRYSVVEIWIPYYTSKKLAPHTD